MHLNPLCQQYMPTVLQAITESNTLSQLLARMDQSQNCLKLILERIPLGLHTSVQAGPLTDESWCLLVSNASAVAKLKQLIPMMLAAIQGQGFPVQDIRLKRNY
jgi:hypothetical protein